MKRPLRHEELALWGRVAATVRPAKGRAIPALPSAPEPSAPPAQPAPPLAAKPKAPPNRKSPPRPLLDRPHEIEPGRLRRLTREREEHGPRLDLHGLSQDEARARLIGFLRRAQEDGWRAAVIITGKGRSGEGVLRRYTPEWLAAPDLRDVVAGVAEAHRRHGGQGALYVALKRKVRG